ncbi:SRPBCC domain-containing protein [Yoonia sp. BS5-3]|uniref:SRPBCC domain-containing protein n=1 Tax=Yoonia phaeophyticola TaxID=3137369 RepID=A0ABZ2VBU6_9RHOB
MKSYEIRIDIAATPQKLWQVLTVQMPKDPQPFGILRFEGQIAPGARLKLWSEVAPNRAFVLRVEHFDAQRQLVWRGGMPLGLFTGLRRFTLTPHDNGCVFEMRETFTGLMSGLITKSMPDLTPSFEKFAQALKAKAEM